MSQEMPRRIKEDSQLPAEVAIGVAMFEIEKLGADVKLTDAVILLQKAKDLVSDFIDEQNYDCMVERIGQLMDAKPGTNEAAELEILAEKADKYQDKHFRLPKPNIIDRIRFYIEQRLKFTCHCSSVGQSG